jgi:hypothetical protein
MSRVTAFSFVPTHIVRKPAQGVAPGLPKQMGESNYAAPTRLLCVIENYG